MKKIFSLLSVLTISGTVVPTKIAASGYQKEESNNKDISQNNLENLMKENDKSKSPFILPLHKKVPKIKQLGSQYCGPTIGAATLEALGINLDNLLSTINDGRVHPYPNIQNYLADIMRTHHVSSPNNTIGTSPANWANAINSLINEHNLNFRRRYSISYFANHFNLSRFISLIQDSLKNGVPVALGYIGILPDDLTRYFETHGLSNFPNNDNHFILINGISGESSSSGENLNFNYMNPFNGEYGTFTGDTLRFLIGSSLDSDNTNDHGGFLISYNSNFLNVGHIYSSDQSEPMDFSGQNIGSANFDGFLKSCSGGIFKNGNCSSKVTINGNEITTLKFLDNITQGHDLKRGDVYIGTTNGIYLKSDQKLLKVNNIDEKVINITTHKNGNHYAVTDKEEIYFIRTDKFSSHGSLIGEQIFNAKSSNLKKEIKLYYNNKSPKEVTHNWYNESNIYKNKLVMTFKLGKLNPVDYFNKIEFLGSDNDFKNSRVSWTGDFSEKIYNSDYNLNHFNGYNINNLIKNIKMGDSSTSNIPNYFTIKLQGYATRRWDLEWIDIYQGAGLTFYWENNNWYLQLHTSQYGNASAWYGKCFVKMGTGIRLYNE